MQGCTNPSAANYNPAADQENYSCLYTVRRDNVCHLFSDVVLEQTVDRSFTISYSVAGDGWVFYHDYLPDFYINSRESLFSLNKNIHFKHHEGPAGVFYDNTPKPFFIDMIFATDSDILLENVTWVTEFLNKQETDSTFGTLTHISIWNSTQHSGRIPLEQVFTNLHFDNIRRTKGSWNLNDFRNILLNNPGDFLKSIFENYSLDTAKVDQNKSWYNKMPLQDKWFCIRFEYDNSVDAQVIIHDTTIQAKKQDR